MISPNAKIELPRILQRKQVHVYLETLGEIQTQKQKHRRSAHTERNTAMPKESLRRRVKMGHICWAKEQHMISVTRMIWMKAK